MFAKWQSGSHAKTQADVASELSTDRATQTPDDVINGSDAEDCIACHAPEAVTVAGITSESDALGYFFTTTNGTFTASTQATNTSDWPEVNCDTCHNLTASHETTPQYGLGYFDSQTAKFVAVDDPSKVCGQCHGNLHFADTDHLTYNAWTTSKHAATQQDVADELGQERNGQTPADVITGTDAEDCIACHAPTAVLANGGMTETQALAYFYTTTSGTFTASTTVDHASDWPDVACTACHDPHSPATPAYFNSSTKKYQQVQSADELCGQCHGNLRFPNTDHLSYNIEQGTGGIGVPDSQLMPGVACTDCHMYNSGVDGSNSASYHGHTWKITVDEANGQTTTSCTKCHATMDTATANSTIAQYQSDFQTLDATVENLVTQATTKMAGNTDATLLADLNEAQSNLAFAESDESGGFHNHTYTMALLNDAQQKAQAIITALP